MSNTNYDVELNISYSNTYRHYIPSYAVAVPAYSSLVDPHAPYYGTLYARNYDVAISFDTESEQQLQYGMAWTSNPPDPLYTDDAKAHAGTFDQNNGPVNITSSGVYSKIYFRNPRRSKVSFTKSNCHVKVNYNAKAEFQVQLNSSGYIPTSNASFKCSTVEKPIPVQYGWSSARVYYKKSTDSSYSSVSGTVSGTWSDITVSTNLSLPTGYTYNIYIQATADDGSVANTSTGNFATTDSEAIATCVSPAGVYTNKTVNFIWSHATSYGTPQYAYDLQYSATNGGSWTTVANHVVSSVNNRTVTINTAGVYIWRVRTYNSMDQAGSWAQASFINNIPATTPTNLVVTTKGRPTATWTSTTQVAYQLQVLLNSTIVYDSGAVYTGENKHFINKYFDDNRSYKVRVRIYNSLGSVSNWKTVGYQQPSVEDVQFSVAQNDSGGAVITMANQDVFQKYYILRNDVVIAQVSSSSRSYTDKFAVGLTNYSVIGVTSADQSDIKTQGFRVAYPRATILTLSGSQIAINKRFQEAFEIQTTNEADVSQIKYIGDSVPTHSFNKMRTKSFMATFFDDNGIVDDLLGTVVFYADNFGNGGYCFVTNYEKTDNFIKNGQGVYANEVALTLEVTNYDDSIEYQL